MKATIKQAFKDGHMERQECPLLNGEYKLKESLYCLRRDLNELDRIKDYKQASDKWARAEKGYLLRCCTPEDIDEWLRDLPLNIAHTLSYSVIPATLALTGDGVPNSQATQLHADAVRRSENLVHKYGAVRPGHTTKNFLVEAIEVIELVLNNAGFKESVEILNNTRPLSRPLSAPFKY